MFFIVTIVREFTMTPEYFGPGLQDQIRKKVFKEVEGSVDGRYGWIVSVVNIDHIPRGLIQEGGSAVFQITFRAIVFRPFRNEILDAVTTSVDETGVWAKAGPLRIYLSKQVRSTSDFFCFLQPLCGNSHFQYSL
jgi:DNA-directed RNA polymerase II subunit RPB7